MDNKKQSLIVEMTEYDMKMIKRLHYTCKFRAIFERSATYKAILHICIPIDAIAIANNYTPTNQEFIRILYILNDRFQAFKNYVIQDAGVAGELNNGDNRGYIIEKIERYVKSIGYMNIQEMLNDYIENNLIYDVMLYKQKKRLNIN